MLGDGNTPNILQAVGFVRVYNNQVVSTTNYGIAIAAGHDNQFYNNRIIASGRLPDNTRPAAQNIGAYIWDIGGDRAKGTFYKNFAYNNTIGWVRADGARNDMWFLDCASSKCTNNTTLSNALTVATEKAEYHLWLNKVASKGIKIGSNF